MLPRLLSSASVRRAARSAAVRASIVPPAPFAAPATPRLATLAVRPATAASHLSTTSSVASGAADMLDPMLGLTPEAAEYAAAATAFAQSEFAPHAAKWDATGTFPEEALRAAARMGFGGLYVQHDVGGAGLSRYESMPIIEALAGADTSTTAYLTIHNMCAWMIDTFGSEELRHELLPQIVSMEHFASYCLTEPDAGSDAGSLATRAVKDGDDYVLNGSKMFISGGGRSDKYVVMTRTSDDGAAGITAFVVDAKSPGLSFGKQEEKLGWRTQPTAAVFFENVRVPARYMLGKEGDGFRIAMRGLNGGRLSIAACSVGAATTCLSLARDYTQSRKQFGKPLAANQAVQFMLADMATRLRASRLMVHDAAKWLDAKHDTAPAMCAMAKRFATDACFDVCNDALQLHGGYGYLQDYPIERFLRDVRVHQILEGTNQIMSVIVARALLQK